jgi:hypothetical protein
VPVTTTTSTEGLIADPGQCLDGAEARRSEVEGYHVGLLAADDFDCLFAALRREDAKARLEQKPQRLAKSLLVADDEQGSGFLTVAL